MNKGLRIALRATGIIAALLICAWIFLWAYITYNKAGIIEKVKAGINQQVKGKVEIRDVSVDFFHNFPNISVCLSGVSIRDSLWSQHHHEFLNAEKIYARIQLFSLFSGRPAIGKLIIENASIYYYTDTTGYTNLVKANGSPGKNNENNLPDLLFKNTRIILDNPGHKKYHDIEFKEMECNISSSDSGRLFSIKMNAIVHGLGFNTQSGSYLKDKSLKGEFVLFFSKTKKIYFDRAELAIDDHPFILSGSFITDGDQPSFSLSIQTKKINLRKTIGLLTQTTQKKFDAYDIFQPIDIYAQLNGLTAAGSIPLVGIDFSVKDAEIETPVGRFNNCSFAGNFTNQIDPARPRLDDNSKISLKKFSGKWRSIPTTANNVVISNLTVPLLKCDLHSSCDLAALNELTGNNSIQFMKGTAQMDINYQGSLVQADTIETIVNGNIGLKNMAINYLPRNIILQDMTGNLVFKNQDLFIETLSAHAGSTALNMNGTVRNLIRMIYIDPAKLTMDWNVSTPYLDLSDFISFLGKKQTVKTTGSPDKFVHIAGKIDQMLEYGTAKLNMQAAKLKYKKFAATNVTTSISLEQNKIILNSARLNHAGGSLLMDGSLSDQGIGNIVKLKSTISNVDIPSLFYAFNNFGQDAITAQNMKGRLTAGLDLSFFLSDKAGIVDKSLKSTVNFSVVNGELNNFEPLQKMAVSIFKKRDFSMVRFAELKDKLEINGSAITINKMEIQSNVFNMFVEGVYDTKKGTDISIQVPLRNLKKINDDEILLNRKKTGLNIRLRAKTGDNGKLNISWDPFRKGGNTGKIKIK